jgi:hypothetical protein
MLKQYGKVMKPTLTQAKDSQRLVNCCVKRFLTRDHVMGWCVGIKVSLFDPQWLQHHEWGQERRNKMFDCCLGSKLHGKEFTTGMGQEFTSLQHHDGHEEETKCLIVVSAVNSIRIYFFAASWWPWRRNKMFDCCLGSKFHGKEFTTGRVKNLLLCSIMMAMKKKQNVWLLSRQ